MTVVESKKGDPETISAYINTLISGGKTILSVTKVNVGFLLIYVG